MTMTAVRMPPSSLWGATDVCLVKLYPTGRVSSNLKLMNGLLLRCHMSNSSNVVLMCEVSNGRKLVCGQSKKLMLTC